jgi:hypothetical protein
VGTGSRPIEGGLGKVVCSNCVNRRYTVCVNQWSISVFCGVYLLLNLHGHRHTELLYLVSVDLRLNRQGPSQLPRPFVEFREIARPGSAPTASHRIQPSWTHEGGCGENLPALL